MPASSSRSVQAATQPTPSTRTCGFGAGGSGAAAGAAPFTSRCQPRAGALLSVSPSAAASASHASGVSVERHARTASAPSPDSHVAGPVGASRFVAGVERRRGWIAPSSAALSRSARSSARRLSSASCSAQGASWRNVTPMRPCASVWSVSMPWVQQHGQPLWFPWAWMFGSSLRWQLARAART